MAQSSGAPLYQLLAMPGATECTPGRPVHNIMLSPYVDYTIGSPQYTWLVNDLKAIDRTMTPFVRPCPFFLHIILPQGLQPYCDALDAP